MMLTTCPQQVVRVGLVGNLENDTTHGQTGRTIHRSRPPADQSEARGKINGEVARHARYPRSILARMSRVSSVSARMSRGYHEETVPVEFKLYALNKFIDLR